MNRVEDQNQTLWFAWGFMRRDISEMEQVDTTNPIVLADKMLIEAESRDEAVRYARKQFLQRNPNRSLQSIRCNRVK